MIFWRTVQSGFGKLRRVNCRVGSVANASATSGYVEHVVYSGLRIDVVLRVVDPFPESFARR